MGVSPMRPRLSPLVHGLWRPCHDMKLTITAETGRALVPLLRRQLRAARKLLRCPLREMSLILVNDRTMSDLHRRFMNLTGPTDVLTFPIDVDKRGRALAGEVYVCVP